MAVELLDGLQSVERLIMPALIQDDIWDSDSGTQNEDIASLRMVLDTCQVVAHLLFFSLRLKEHDIVVNSLLTRLQVNHIDFAAEGC